jgi:hypothetical protein
MKQTVFTATYEGKIVGTRRSPRPYQFAIVVLQDEAADRKRAYEYQATKMDHSNFAYYQEIDRLGENHPHYCKCSWRDEPDLEGIARARQLIEGGFDMYVARLREKAIENFEVSRAAGCYEPHVYAWSMSEKNARKAASSSPYKVLAVVPVGHRR